MTRRIAIVCVATIICAALAIWLTVLTGFEPSVSQNLAKDDVFNPPAIAKNEQAQLIIAHQQSVRAMKRSTELENEAQAAHNDAEKLKKRIAALALRIQSAEADINGGEARVRLVRQRLKEQEKKLQEAHTPILSLTASLTQLSRLPPIAVFMLPGTSSDIIHARLVLDTALPMIETRTANIQKKIKPLWNTRTETTRTLAALKDSYRRLAVRRAKLDQMEKQSKLRSRQLAGSAKLEANRARALGEKVRNIAELIAVLEKDDPTQSLASAESTTPVAPAQSLSSPTTNLTTKNAKLTDAPAYRLPVVGQIIIGMGEISSSDVRSRGLTIATQPAGQVVAPANGRVVFASLYRSYGEIIIIDHGKGWSSLLTGMTGLSVSVGEIVAAGSPIGRTKVETPRITVELRYKEHPVDIVALIG